jgi:hypothetical protein
MSAACRLIGLEAPARKYGQRNYLPQGAFRVLLAAEPHGLVLAN